MAEPTTADRYEVATSAGPARVHIHPARGPAAVAGTLVLGHGAGGGVGAADLQSVTRAASAAGWQVLLVEQPWRVAGRRVAAAPGRLDDAWQVVLAELAAGRVPGVELSGPLVAGGRSAGARVACRTALATAAAAACCLAFPLHPPGRPERSRAAELAEAGVPVLVVQGRADPFGGPGEIAALGLPHVEVVAVSGDHGLARSTADVGAAVARWLGRLGPDGELSAIV